MRDDDRSRALGIVVLGEEAAVLRGDAEADIVRFMDGNICRCGTYQRIIDAIKLAASRMPATGAAQ